MGHHPPGCSAGVPHEVLPNVSKPRRQMRCAQAEPPPGGGPTTAAQTKAHVVRWSPATLGKVTRARRDGATRGGSGPAGVTPTMGRIAVAVLAVLARPPASPVAQGGLLAPAALRPCRPTRCDGAPRGWPSIPMASASARGKRQKRTDSADASAQQHHEVRGRHLGGATMHEERHAIPSRYGATASRVAGRTLPGCPQRAGSVVMVTSRRWAEVAP